MHNFELARVWNVLHACIPIMLEHMSESGNRVKHGALPITLTQGRELIKAIAKQRDETCCQKVMLIGFLLRRVL